MALLLALPLTYTRGASLDEARALYGEGKIAEAADAFRAAALELESTDPLTAAIALNNACVLERGTGDIERAEEDCRHALRLRSGEDSTEAQAKTYNNLGLVLQRRAAYEEARRAFDRALRINRDLDLAANQAINLSNLGVNAIQAGWYGVAIELFGQIESLTAQHEEEPWASRQRELARINLAVVHERLGAYREALRLYDEALEPGRELPPGQRATLSVNRAVAYRNLGDPVTAEKAFAAAENTYRELGDRPALLNVLLNRALVQHLNLDRLDTAEPFYREALALAAELGEATQRLQCLDYLGRFLLDLDRVDEAEALFREAHDLAEESGSSEARAASLEGLGRCALSRGDTGTALERALEGIEGIEQVRGSLDSDRLRASYHGEKRLVYALAVEAIAGENTPVGPDGDRALEALHIAHRAKARELVDQLGVDGSLSPTGERPPVGAGHVLLEYFVAGDRLFGWLVTDRTVEMRDLGPAAPVIDGAVRVHARLSRSQLPDPETLDALQRQLFQPFSEKALRAGRWTVSTDRGLDRLPFELLPDPSNAGQPLVLRVNLGYLPSGAMLGATGRDREGSVIVGIGDPVQAGQKGPASYFARRLDLGPLKGAAEELASLSGWIDEPVELSQGSTATEEEFSRLYSKGARVVHIATHTVLEKGPERSSAILLTPGDSSDGLLRPAEIARLDGASRLTVLAACRTAANGAGDEFGLRDLTGAFLVSGSSAVVATLWDVGDVATRVFMEQFYHGLDRGQRPDEALAEAKRTLIADPSWHDPAVWSAYVLIGDAGPVSGGGFPVGLALAVFVVSATAYGWWRYGRISKSVR